MGQKLDQDSGLEPERTGPEARLSIRLAPNCSLTRQGAWLFFLACCAGSFTVAGFMAWRGFWPILPFAGLEMIALAIALALSMRRRAYSETIVVTEERIEIESQDRGGRERIVFPRHWAQVKLRRAESTLHPSRLTIESHGRQFEVGRFLTEEERRGLATRLRQLIGRVSESPELAPLVRNTKA